MPYSIYPLASSSVVQLMVAEVVVIGATVTDEIVGGLVSDWSASVAVVKECPQDSLVLFARSVASMQ